MASKKIFFLLIFPVISILIFLFVSCEKETKLVYEERLTGVTWKMYDCRIVPDSSIYYRLDSCIKDNYEKYRIDGTYTKYEGVKKCNPADPIEQRGTWVFSSDRKTLHLIDYKGKKTSYDVIELTNVLLHISYLDSSSNKIILFFKPKT